MYSIKVTQLSNPANGGEFRAELEMSGGLVGYGSTEQEAISALKSRVEEEIETLKTLDYTKIYRPEPEEIEDGE